MKKQLLTTLSAILLTSLLSGCSTSAKTSDYDYLLDTTKLTKADLDLDDATGDLKKILDDGVLKIATSPDFPPCEWIDDKGNVYGAEMALAKYVADTLGVKLEIETMDFAATLAALDTDKVDLVFSGLGWKSDRSEQYELSVGYIGDDTSDLGHTLITTKENEGKYKTLSDFVGETIVAQATSLQEMYVQDEILSLKGDTKYEPVKTLDQAILSLTSGKCDAVALAESTAQSYVANSDGKLVMTGVYFDLTPYKDYEGYVAAAKKGETDLINTLNTILQTVKDNNYFQQWFAEAKEASQENA